MRSYQIDMERKNFFFLPARKHGSGPLDPRTAEKADRDRRDIEKPAMTNIQLILEAGQFTEVGVGSSASIRPSAETAVNE